MVGKRRIRQGGDAVAHIPVVGNHITADDRGACHGGLWVDGRRGCNYGSVSVSPTWYSSSQPSAKRFMASTTVSASPSFLPPEPTAEDRDRSQTGEGTKWGLFRCTFRYVLYLRSVAASRQTSTRTSFCGASSIRISSRRYAQGLGDVSRVYTFTENRGEDIPTKEKKNAAKVNSYNQANFNTTT